MAGENIPRTLKNATVVIYDHNAGNSLTLTLEDGDINLTIPAPHEHVLDRGGIGSLVDGEFAAITGSMTVQMRELTGSTATLAEVALGKASGWTYTPIISTTDETDFETAASATLVLNDKLADAAAAVKVMQMEITFANPASGGTDEVWYLINVVTESFGFAEGMPNKFTWNFTSYMTKDDFVDSVNN